MNILILGANGQLGFYLQENLQKNSLIKVTPLNIDQLDITINFDLKKKIIAETQPNIIINCAAYTNVDKAESNVTLANNVNGEALKDLSTIANELNAELIHISTDFVFSGQNNVPYREDDICEPISIYGKSKRDGEMNIQAYCENYAIFRTSWLYSNSHPCFYKTMLMLAEKNNDLRIIYDQVGSPTSAKSLTSAIVHYIQQKTASAKTIFHASNEGVCSWYDFAHAIFQMNSININLTPIETKDYPTPATRPAFSVLSKQKFYDSYGFRFPHWTDALREVTQK